MLDRSVADTAAKITLADNAYRSIRDRILSGEFPLGQPLSRRKLAGQLGMSFVPVSEALQRLERERLVESRARSGTRVCIPSSEEVRGYYILREALESQAARLFAERATIRQKSELARLARQVDKRFSAPPLVKMDRQKHLFETHRLHFEFHMRIAEFTRCRELVQALETNQVLIFHWLYNSAAHFDTVPPDWHQTLIDALCSGDPDQAERAMRHHVRFRADEVAARIGAYLVADRNDRHAFRGAREPAPSRRRRSL